MQASNSAHCVQAWFLQSPHIKRAQFLGFFRHCTLPKREWRRCWNSNPCRFQSNNLPNENNSIVWFWLIRGETDEKTESTVFIGFQAENKIDWCGMIRAFGGHPLRHQIPCPQRLPPAYRLLKSGFIVKRIPQTTSARRFDHLSRLVSGPATAISDEKAATVQAAEPVRRPPLHIRQPRFLQTAVTTTLSIASSASKFCCAGGNREIRLRQCNSYQWPRARRLDPQGHARS
jgi:hypothetical protein